MKVTLLQTNITWAEPSDNQRNAEEMISQAQDSDMYILPEMWSTGFATQPHGIAEDEETSGKSGSLAWMKDMAARKKASICGSLAIRTCEGQYVNRLFLVFPDGTYRHYV
ncbi:nitrilase-related carbon-nitrogen hydrolase, partial [uncultured Prevotella sp.]|uniref:nitrilase-related carbon-nitrogen hydrolase n=1 Tax=uncultured Prevotella sp. TaxID=159272 RepID=UPI0028057581